MVVGAVPQAATAEPPRLQSPVRCPAEAGCLVQQYVDVAPGPEARDYRCGGVTYDGHDGTDFRVPFLADVERGVSVVAAAAGRVRAAREGMPDRIVAGAEGRAAIKGRECGNGVMIDHADGWQTQYCHMKQGSLAVKKGDTVKAGDLLGSVGYSGNAAFAHLHFTVRHRSKIIDPFSGKPPDGGCGATAQNSLWTEDARAALAYRPGQIVAAGFAAGRVAIASVENGLYREFSATRDTPALVGWGWMVNLRAGDTLEIVLTAADGKQLTRHSLVLDRNKAQYVSFAGRKRPPDGWPQGDYNLSVSVMRNGRELASSSRSLRID